MSLRLVVIGAGTMGALHAANAERAGAKVVAVVDTNAEAGAALAARFDASAFTDVEQSLAGRDVGAIVIATHEANHPTMLAALVGRRLPIFCEKPLGLDMNECHAVYRAALDQGAYVFFGFNRRFDPSRSALKAAIDRGSIGRPETVRIISADTPETINFHFAGGIFFNPYSHDLDTARWLLGEEAFAVSAFAAELVEGKGADNGLVDTAVVTLQTASGSLASLSYSRRATHGHDQRIEVSGSDGMLQIDNLRLELVVESGDGGVRSAPIEPDFRIRYADAYAIEMQRFVDDVIAGRPPAVTIGDAWASMLLGAAAERASRNRTVEDPRCWRPDD